MQIIEKYLIKILIDKASDFSAALFYFKQQKLKKIVTCRHLLRSLQNAVIPSV